MSVRVHLRFLLILVLAIAAWWPSLRVLVELAIHNANYSYVLLVLFVSCVLLCVERWPPPVPRKSRLLAALVPAVALAVAAWWNYRMTSSNGDLRLSLSLLLFFVFILTAFLQTYGRESFSHRRFPLLFLMLAVPLPAGVVSWLIAGLQQGTADVTAILFRMFHVPVIRNGLVFSFSNFEVEVAEECSGIRSSTILFVTTLVLAQMYLRSARNKVIAVICSVPIAVFKNGVRIFVLSVLGEYFSESWLQGSLHHQGGFVFFALGLAIVVAIIWLLRSSEERGKSRLNRSAEGLIERRSV